MKPERTKHKKVLVLETEKDEGSYLMKEIVFFVQASNYSEFLEITLIITVVISYPWNRSTSGITQLFAAFPIIKVPPSRVGINLTPYYESLCLQPS